MKTTSLLLLSIAALGSSAIAQSTGSFVEPHAPSPTSIVQTDVIIQPFGTDPSAELRFEPNSADPTKGFALSVYKQGTRHIVEQQLMGLIDGQWKWSAFYGTSGGLQSRPVMTLEANTNTLSLFPTGSDGTYPGSPKLTISPTGISLAPYNSGSGGPAVSLTQAGITLGYGTALNLGYGTALNLNGTPINLTSGSLNLSGGSLNLNYANLTSNFPASFQSVTASGITGSQITASQSLRVGFGAVSIGVSSLAVGNQANANAAIALGQSATASAGGIAIGAFSSSNTGYGIALGGFSHSSAEGAVALGQGTASGDYSVAINGAATAQNAVALAGAAANAEYSVAAGNGIQTFTAHQMVVGRFNSPYVPDTADPLPGAFVVGAGTRATADSPAVLRNALRVLDDGTVLIQPGGNITMAPEFSQGERP